jgi:hypothetical protein
MTNFITDDLINANARCIFTLNTTSPVGSGGTFDFTSEVSQSGGFTAASGDIFVPADGTYHISWRIGGISDVPATGQTYASKNNTGIAISARSSSGGSDGRSLDGSGYLELAKGDAVRIKMADATFPGQNSGASNSFFSITRVSDYSAGEPAGFGLATETQAGLVRRHETGTFTLDNGFTNGGTLYYELINNTFTLSLRDNLTFTGSTIISSSAGLIPARFIPFTDTFFAFAVHSSAAVVQIQVGTNGAFIIEPRDYSGTSTPVGALQPMTASWIVDE